jgi:hypothetical protein
MTKALSNAAKQAEFKRRQREAGLVQLTLWVPAETASDMRQLAVRLVADRDLMPGPPRRRNGRYAKQRAAGC